jgi:hypothetical protein
MGLKTECTQPLPGWLKNIDLRAGLPEFPLMQVLGRSLYYPACGFDGRPVQFLAGFIHSFIYVDYGTEKDCLRNELEECGFKGYRLARQRPLRRDELAPSEREAIFPHQFRRDGEKLERPFFQSFIKEPFAIWYIFEREEGVEPSHGPERFSLVYLAADGVAAYQVLYLQRNTAPLVLALIQPGAGFGGAYTDFRDPAGLLAHTVLRTNGDAPVPEYLVCGGQLLDYDLAFWPDDYPVEVERFQHARGNGVWRRNH